MDEEISIIDTKTRNEKIKNFIIKNKILLISFFSLILISVISFYSIQIYKDGQKEKLSNKYNGTIIEFESGQDANTISLMKEIINQKDSTYSPLALYFLIDKNLLQNRDEINNLFNVLINKTPLDEEIKNLIIYKKALYNADFIEENELIEILSPVINSESVWKSHALYLIGEYFYSKNEKKKSKEFILKIFEIKNANEDIRIEAQKRLKRDLSE